MPKAAISFIKYLKPLIQTKLKIMAEINVEKKDNNIPWWVWLIVALVVAAILYFLLSDNDGVTDDDRGRMQDREQVDTVRRQDTAPGASPGTGVAPGGTAPDTRDGAGTGTDTREQPQGTSDLSPIQEGNFEQLKATYPSLEVIAFND